jgi:hypothetical protein
MDGLSENDLICKVVIRGQELDVTEACLTNIFHCGYYISQMVHIA